jgi:branched-chain amino acid transport system substrate-binding protein
MIAVLALVAAACSSDDGTDTTEAAAATTTEAAAATTAAPGTTAAASTTTEAAMAVCEGGIGSMFPITGPVAFIGEVQNNWAKYAIEVYNAEHGTAYEYVEGDTMFDVAQASILAAQIVDDGSIMAVVGPAGSDQTDAAGAAFEAGDANLVFISPSSTREGITTSYSGMFRTVPTDNAQALTTAAFMVDGGAAKVFMIDDQSSYSTGLAEAVVVLLEAGGVEVITESVAQDVTDFSALVGTIPDDTDWIYLPWQVAANGQILGNQLAEQGKDIPIFGSDGMDSGDFTIAGSVIANFAPDISILTDKADLLEGYLAEYPDTNTFGPPTFAAVTVIAEAYSRVCNADGEITRGAVLAEVKATDQADSIVGSPINFDENGDLLGGKFFLAEIQDDGSKAPTG